MIISILNHKGGTGKTTTTINVGRALTMQNKSVLLIDLDSQANLTYSLGIEIANHNIGEVLFKSKSLRDVVVKREGMDVVPANFDLYQYEESIIKYNYGFELLKDALKHEKYDFILIDCPPSQSQLNINALCASDKVLVPILMDVLSLQGLNQILNTVDEVKRELNPALEVLGILGVLVDDRKQLTRDVLEHIQSHYSITVFNSLIRASVKAAEAPSHGLSILAYAPNSKSALDYISLSDEILMLV